MTGYTPEAGSRPTLLLVESNTTGSGRQFWLRAQSLDLRPVMLSADPQRYPTLFDDQVEVVQVDTRDEQALLAAARRQRGVVGVVTSSDLFAVPAAHLAKNLGLRGDDPDCVAACRNKGRQRELLADAGVPGASFQIATTADEAVLGAEAIGLPVVVKPLDGSGSVGVRLCNDAREVAEWAGKLLTERSELLVEEFIVGPEYSVELFSKVPVMVVAKLLGEPPQFLEIGHDLPAPLRDVDAQELRDTAAAAVAALGVGTFAAHVELRLCADGPRIIEVNPRLAGGMIPRAVQRATGQDLVESVIRAAAGLPPSDVPRHGGAAAIRFLVAPREGVITGWALPQPNASDQVDVVMLAGVGNRLELNGSFRDRVCCFVAGGRDLDEARDRAARALAASAVYVA